MREIGRHELHQALKKVRPTVLDRVIGWADPVRGAQRLRGRFQMAVAGTYVGGSKTRRSMSQWKTSGGSADEDLVLDRETVRDRARDLVRNNALASGTLGGVVSNAVGTGLRMKPMIDREVLGLGEDEADAWQRAAGAEWGLFSGSPECDAAGVLDFDGQSQLALRSTLENGDTFALLAFREKAPWPYGLRVQLIEADRVDNPLGKADTETLFAGIEKDRDGRPLRYHVLNSHPGGRFGAGRLEGRWVPAFTATGRRNMLHLFDPKRIGQSRGVSYFAPVIEPLRILGEYTTAELMAATVSGFFTVFVKSETGGLNLNPMQPTAETGAKGTDDDVKLGYGAMVGLGPGEDVIFADPKRPTSMFDPFVMAILRQIGVGLELPFEVMIKHFTASYSASRAALLDAWRFYKGRRAWLVRSFCQPVYEALVEEAVARGRLAAPGFFDDPMVRRAYLGARWTGPAPGQIDEQKAVAAARDRMDADLTTLDEETAAMTGGEWLGNLRQKAIERRAREDAGLSGPAPATTFPAPAGGTGQDGNQDMPEDETAVPT